MIFLVLTLIAIITIIILANQKELYFVSLAFKKSKSYLCIHIFQVLVIYFSLTLADYGNHVYSIFIFLFSVSEILKLVSLKQIVNKEINAETNIPYKLTDVISRFSIYSRIIFLIVVNIVVNCFLFK